jgi:hypothetical protein
MPRRKNGPLKDLPLHAQLCVFYGLTLVRVLAGPKPAGPDACKGIIPLLKELNECLKETAAGLGLLSSRLTCARTSIFCYGALAEPNACYVAFAVGNKTMQLVLPALVLIPDGETAAAEWLFKEWDNLARSLRGQFPFGPEDHKSLEESLAAEIISETEKAAQGAGAIKRKSALARKAEVPGVDQDRPEAKKIDKKSAALALLIQHPDWTDKRIAEQVGVNRTTLYEWQEYKAARAAQKGGKRDLPTGYKDSDRNIEALG